MKKFANLREIVDSQMEFDAVYIKLAHPAGDGYFWSSPTAITSMDEMLPRLMDLSLKSYSFVSADYYLNVGFDYLAVLYLYFAPTKDHSTNIDGDFIDTVSRIRIQSALDTSNRDMV